MTKSELRTIIREMLKEELSKKTYRSKLQEADKSTSKSQQWHGIDELVSTYNSTYGGNALDEVYKYPKVTGVFYSVRPVKRTYITLKLSEAPQPEVKGAFVFRLFEAYTKNSYFNRLFEHICTSLGDDPTSLSFNANDLVNLGIISENDITN